MHIITRSIKTCQEGFTGTNWFPDRILQTLKQFLLKGVQAT